ncbi:MAG: DPP IV N-terminal domain-containing protein, partial [Planctomycetota bacterium]|nr:DPP IV N-terminal domain-containing protein [Planctomycetota bacterium]
KDGRSILHLQEIDGTSHVRYADFPGDISRPIWSPDGSHIVFTGTQRGISRQYKDLWALRVQGNQFVGVAFPVIPDVEQIRFYNWAQNGQLAYRTGFQLGGLFTLPVDPQTGKATGAPRRVVRRSGLDSFCWSPDGKQIATRQGSEMSFISTSNGERIRNLSLSGIENVGRGMSWSPDGKLIALCGVDKEKRTGIFLIGVESGDVRLLVGLEKLPPNYDPTWSPDSKTIAYGHKNNVYVVNIEDGKPNRITDSPEKPGPKGYVGRPVFAPDGRSVAYLTGQRKDGKPIERILMTTIDGQETREIFRTEDKKRTINIFDLSPDSRHIVFTPGDKEIWYAPIGDGEPFKIGDISNVGDDAWAWMPKWSPMGDAITFIVTCEKYQYWVMEDFLLGAEAAGQ